MANEHSQIVPSMQPTATVADFKFWCQKVLPLVYDDSLSYYEVLNKMVVYLNQVIDNINADIENVEELEDDFLLLQEYVNNFFDDIDQLVTYTERAEAAETSAISYAASAAESASNSATSASNSASSASSSATSALSAMDAKDAAVAAKTAAETALASAQTAATNAAASATAASGSAINAQTAASAASTSATLADTAAQTATSKATEATTAAASAEEVLESIPEDYTTLSDDVDDLKSKVNNGLIDLTPNILPGRVLNGTYDPVTLEPQVNADWVYAIIDCTEGDVFYVSGSGGTSYRPYSFVTGDESPYTTLELWNYPSDPAVNVRIVAPHNATKLVFDSRANYDYALSKEYYPPIFSKYVNDNLAAIDAKANFKATYENGIQDWWLYPVGAYIKGIREKTYYTFTDANGDQGVFEYDYATKETHKRVLNNETIDEHCTPAIIAMQDNRLMVALTGHNDTSIIKLFISKYPETIEDFDDPIIIDVPSGTLAYAQLLYSSSKYWLFTRHKTLDNKFKWYVASSSDGETWSDLKPFIDGVNTQCYLMVRNYSDDLLKIYETSNVAARDNTAIRLCYLNTANGNILNVDKSTIIANIGTMQSAVAYSDLSIVLDKPNNTALTQRLLSCGVGTDMTIAVSVVEAGSGRTNAFYYIGDYSESNHTYTLTDFPYLGGVFQAYMTQQIEIMQDCFVASTSKNAGKTIEVYTRSGSTFTKAEELATEPADTDIKLLRPFMIIGKKAVVYERGIRAIDDYTSFYTDLHLAEIT